MVAGISLLDAVGKLPSTYDGDSPAELQAQMGNELVAACLDEYRHIEALDVCGPTRKWRRLYVRETEAHMRQLHEAWLAPARDLLMRMREMAAAGVRVERLEDLEIAVLTTRGLLATTLDDIEAGREQIRQGKCHSYATVEELRRDIRAERERRRACDTDNPAA